MDPGLCWLAGHRIIIHKCTKAAYKWVNQSVAKWSNRDERQKKADTDMVREQDHECEKKLLDKLTSCLAQGGGHFQLSGVQQIGHLTLLLTSLSMSVNFFPILCSRNIKG